MIRDRIKQYEFDQTPAYKKYEEIESQLLNHPNVVGVSLDSKINEPIAISVLLKQPDPNFLTDIDGIKVKIEVCGGAVALAKQ